MAILVTIHDIGKAFGVRPLFEGLSFVVGSGDRIGLIGPNGAGKSTLLSILATQSLADSGVLSFQRGLRIGFLEQTPRLPFQTSVQDAVFAATKDPRDGVTIQIVSELLSRLSLSALAHSRIDQLSGGWRKRVALACELVKEPQLLLLDEPTNHLDVESILWLESFLAKAPFATVTVTHDRLFLQRVANRILELDQRNPQGLLAVRGDYAIYLERKEELLKLQQRQKTVLSNKLRRETEWLEQGAKARTTKQQARIQAAEELRETVEELEFRNQDHIARLDFQSFEKKPKCLIEARAISKAFGGRYLFKGLSLFVGPGSRIGLLGPNGCGKSTLIRVLLGMETPDSGSVLRSEYLRVAYLEQSRDTLDPSRTLRETICPSADHVNYRGRMVHILGYLDRFLFQKEQVDMPVGRLSGGEQSRILLAQLMLKEANVLVLDEPTNDLDIETLDVLQDCLIDFEGAVVLVTHDRFFLDQVTNEIFAFSNSLDKTGEVLCFAGLAQWEDWYNKEARTLKVPAKNSFPVVAQENISKKRKLSFNEARELKQMEENIQKAEARLAEMEAETQLSVNQSNAGRLSELYQSIAQTQIEIEQLYARWVELEKIKAEASQ